MRVLLLGGSGFIGSAVLARLTAAGHEVIAVARRPGAPRQGVEWRRLDIAGLTRTEAWQPHIQNVQAIVNCAGALQSAPGSDLRGVHVDGVAALFRACEQVRVRRVVHLSALVGSGPDAPGSPFSASKAAGEAALRECDLDWVILRPSVVLGRAAYGGSALMRGLAGLPVLLDMPRAGLLQVVWLDDIVETILLFLKPDAPARIALDVAGPERLGLPDVVRRYRRWLRFPETRVLPVPELLARAGYRAGDFARVLGWNSPISTTARLEMEHGTTGDPEPWRRATGIEPRSLGAALEAEPVSVQERWFARLYFLKPVTFAVLAVFWIATGLISLGPGWHPGIDYLLAGGVPPDLAGPGVIAGALADIVIGIGIAFRRTARGALCAALGLSAFYMAAGTLILPVLWSDPVGPMLKIWPIIVLILVAIAILPDR